MPKRYLTDEKVAEVARGYVENKYFFSTQIPPHSINLLGQVFMPILFMEDKTRKLLIKDDVVCFYEDYSKKGPWAINGFPMFTSMGMMTREDYKRVMELVEKLDKAMADVLGPTKANDNQKSPSVKEVTKEVDPPRQNTSRVQKGRSKSRKGISRPSKARR